MSLNLTFHVFGCFVVFLAQWQFSIIKCYIVVMNNISSNGLYPNENRDDVCVCVTVVFHLFLICENFTVMSRFYKVFELLQCFEIHPNAGILKHNSSDIKKA